MALNFTPGAAAGWLLGWGPVGAVVLGGITSISSSGIIATVLNDLGRVGNRETPVMLSVLVFEDLAMAVHLPLMTALVAGSAFAAGLRTVGIALVAVATVLFTALRFGPQISRLVCSPEQETFLLKVLGLALLVAGVAGRWRAGAALTIRGEFSIVIAGLATASGTLPAEVPAFATAHVLILAVAGPLLTRSADGFGRRRAAAARVREARRARQAPLV